MAFVAEMWTVEDEEHEGGFCPVCHQPAEKLQCWQCCEVMWMIACPHRPQPPPMRRGRRDGSDLHRVFCSDCAAPLD